MKKIISIFAAVLFCAAGARASLLTLTNLTSQNLPDTNVIKSVQADTNEPTLADGTVTTIGFPIIWHPDTNGVVQIYEVQGNYLIFGAHYGRGMLYCFTDNSSNATCYPMSGYNKYYTVVFSNNTTVTITNINALTPGPGGSLDASLVTNVQGATAISGIIPTNNLPMDKLVSGSVYASNILSGGQIPIGTLFDYSTNDPNSKAYALWADTGTGQRHSTRDIHNLTNYQGANVVGAVPSASNLVGTATANSLSVNGSILLTGVGLNNSISLANGDFAMEPDGANVDIGWSGPNNPIVISNNNTIKAQGFYGPLYGNASISTTSLAVSPTNFSQQWTANAATGAVATAAFAAYSGTSTNSLTVSPTNFSQQWTANAATGAVATATSAAYSGTSTNSLTVSPTNFSQQWTANAATGAVATATSAAYSGTSTNLLGLATASIVTNGVFATVCTNNQVIANSGTYFLPAGISASINITNGGQVAVLGSGIITSNLLSMGAVENIFCDQYCPNGGVTQFNHYTNQWQSVTCNIQSRLVDFNQGTSSANNWFQFTTNQSDVFVINATERLNFWELEVFLDGSGTNHSAYFLNTIPPYIQWTTPYFFTGYCGSNNLISTLNCISGSSISCGIWDCGDITGNTGGSSCLFQIWTGRGNNNAFVTLSAGEVISTAADNYLAQDAGWEFVTYCTSSNLENALNGGLVLANIPYAANTNALGPDVDFVTGNPSGKAIVGIFYDAFSKAFVTNQPSLITNAAPTVAPASLLPSSYAGLNFNGQTAATLVSQADAIYSTNTSFTKPLVYTGNGSGLTNTPAVSLTIPSNTWSLVTATQGMVNGQCRIGLSNYTPVVIVISNNVPVINYLGLPAGGIIP